MNKQITRTFLMLIAFLMSINLAAQSVPLLDESFSGIATGIPSAWDNSTSSVADPKNNWVYYASDGKCLRFDYRYSNVGETGILKTPLLNLPVEEMTLSFSYKNTKGAEFAVYISTDGGVTYKENVLASGLTNQTTWARKEIRLKNYTNQANVKIIFYAISTKQAAGYVYLDDVKLEATDLCATPIDFYTTGLSQNQATLNWTLDDAVATSSIYKLVVKDKDGVEVQENDALVTQGNFTVISGLTPNTTYSALLQSDCSVSQQGTSKWSEPFSFSTLCEPISLPVSYNFFNDKGILPECWIAGGLNSKDVKLTAEQSAGTVGDKSIKMSSTVDNDAFFVTPNINHPANDMEIHFKVCGPMGVQFLVLLTNDVGDVSAATPILQESISQTNKWTDYIINTSEIEDTTEGYSLGFYLAPGNASTIYIDDISIIQKPSCVRPDKFKVEAITNSSAKLSWMADGSNIQLRVNGELREINTNPYVLTSLSINTTYDVAIREICSVGDTSAWSKDIRFRTADNPIVYFPIIENFNGGVFPPANWITKQIKAGENYGEDYGDYTWKQSEYFSYQGKAAELRVSKTGTHTLLVMPYMTIPSVETHELSFYMYRDDSGKTKEAVRVWVNSAIDTLGGKELIRINLDKDLAPIEQRTGWYKYTVPITVKGNIFIMFEGINENNYSSSTTFIDNVVVRERPSCLPVLEIMEAQTTATEVSFSWAIEEGSASEWIVSYQSSDMLEATEEIVSQPNYTLSGLTPNTPYSCIIKVKSKCSASDESDEISFETNYRTKCQAVELPYSEKFENNFNASRQLCWTYLVTSGSSWNLYPRLTTDETDEIHMNGLNVVVSPEMNVDSWIGKRVSFDLRGTSTLRVGIMSNKSDTTTFVLLETITASVEKTNRKIDITEEYSGRYIAFITNENTGYLDNFRVEITPDCEGINSLSVNDISQNSVELIIVDDLNSKWEMQYSILPFNESASTEELTVKNSTLSGLISNTKYGVRVRSMCNAVDKGNWSDLIEFQTKCEGFAVTSQTPFIENFETGFKDNEIIAGCWLQISNSGKANWVANSSLPEYTAKPYQGIFHAYFKATEGSYLIYALDLKANTNYHFSCFIGRMAGSESKASSYVSISKDATNVNAGSVIIENRTIKQGGYSEASSYFFVPEDGTYYIKIGVKDPESYPYYSIDNIMVREVQCAPTPLNMITVESVTANGVTIKWNSIAPKSTIKISTAPIDPNSNEGVLLSELVEGKEFNTTALQSNTKYYYYIKSICGEDSESLWSEEGTFRTLCSSFNLPYVANFDDNIDDLICWNSLETKPTLDGAYKRSGNQSWKCQGVFLVSPELNVTTLTDKQLTSYIYTDHDTVRISVGVVTNPKDIATFEPMNDIVITDKGEWKEIISYFDLLNDPNYTHVVGAKYIAIKISDQYTAYLDDIRIETLPSCPKLTGLTVTELSDTSLVLDWAPNNEASWKVTIVSNGEEVKEMTVNAHPATIQGLMPNTEYEMRARAICDVNDESGYVYTKVRTQCPLSQKLPFVEDFNNLNNGEITDCWINDYLNMSHNSTYNEWKAYIGNETATPSYEFNSSINEKDRWSILESPLLDLTGLSSATLEFEAMNPVGGDLQVLLSQDNGVSFTETLILSIKNVNVMTLYNVDLSQYCGGKVTIGFKGVSNQSSLSSGYIRIDNVSVFEPAICDRPDSISVVSIGADSVTFTINDFSSASMWEVAIAPVDVPFNKIKDFTVVTSKTSVLKNLIPATRYIIYARTVCEDTKSWHVSSERITTNCAKLSLPYKQGFESVAAIGDILCTDILTEKTSNVILNTSAANVLDGAQSIRFTSNNGITSYFVLPEINAPIDTVSVSFYYKNGGTAKDEAKIEIGLMPLYLDAADFILVKSYPISNNYTLAEADFVHSGIEGFDYRIAIRIKENGAQPLASKYIAVDNIEVKYRKACVTPAAVDVKNVTTNSVDVMIFDKASSKWDIAYGTAKTAFENLTVISNVTSDSIRISSLNSSTSYQVYARTVCAEGVSTEWTAATTFATECADVTLDKSSIYEEDFQSYAHNQPPSCWLVIKTETRSSLIYPTVLDNMGSKGLGFMGPNGIIAMPKFSESINKLNMQLDATFTGSGRGEISIGYTNDLSKVVDLKKINIYPEGNQYIIDLTIFPSDAQYIVLRQTAGYGAIVDNVKVYLAPTCYAPKNVKVNNISNVGFDASYVVSPENTQVEYAIYKEGTVVASAWTTNNPLTVTGLDAKTEYTLFVRSECSSDGILDTTIWSDPVVFTTYQTPAALPYNKGFEDLDDNSSWTVVGPGPNQWVVSSEDANAIKGGSSALYVSKNKKDNEFDNTSLSKSWAYRTFSLDEGVYSLSYFYKLAGSPEDYMRVFLAPATLDLASSDNNSKDLIVVDHGRNLFHQNNWKEITKDIIIRDKAFYNLAVLWRNDVQGGFQRPAAFDDISFEKYSCAPLLESKVVFVGEDTISIALNGYVDATLSYQIILKTDPSVITQSDINEAIIIESSNDTLCLNGLESYINYYAYVRTICSEGDTSKWSSSMSFRTTCSATVINETSNFFEGFETYTQSQTIDGCWRQEKIKGENSWKANLELGDYKLTSRSGIVHAALGLGQSSNLVREVYLEAGKSYLFSLWGKPYGGASKVTISLLTTPGVEASLVNIVEKDLNYGEYQEVAGVYTPTKDGVYTMKIGVAHASMGVNYLLLDDISVALMCLEPVDVNVSDVTTTSVNINWKAESDSTRIKITALNFSLDTTLLTITGNNTFLLEGIEPSTEYSVEVTNICATYTSESQNIVFTTLCAAKNLPYRENFEAYKVNDLPLCWDNTEGSVMKPYRWSVFRSINIDGGTNNFMRFNSYSSKKGEDNVLKTVTLDVKTANYTLSFDYKNPAGGAMSVFLSKDQGLTYSDTLLNAVTTISDWQTCTKDLKDYAGEELTMVVYSVSNNKTISDAYHYLDNLEISCDGGDRNIYDTICQNSPYVGYGFNISGTETKKSGLLTSSRERLATTPEECDTTVILNLLVNETYNLEINDKFCKGTTYNKGLFQNINTQGKYLKEFVSSAGCDSIVTLYLSYYNEDVVLTKSICEGNPYNFGGKELSKTGVYKDTVVGSHGCDSVTVLYLTVNPKYYELKKVVCEGQDVVFEGVTYSTSGRFEHGFKNKDGCDSIRMLDLTVQQTNYTIDSTICSGQSVFFNGELRSKTGTYDAQYIRVGSGCDSIVTLNLIVNPIDTTVFYDYACEGKPYYNHGFSGVRISSDSILYHTNKGLDGCNSTIELHLRFSPTQVVYDTVNIGAGQVYEFGDNTLSVSGDYKETFPSRNPNSENCDSTVYLHLNIATNLRTIEAKTLMLAPNPIEKLGYSVINRDWTLEEQKGMRMDVIDDSGRTLYSTTVTEFPIIVNDIAVSGIYYVRIITGTGDIYTGKLVVK